MNVLVTGGAGFIGGHLTDRLIDEGHDVRVLDSLANGLPPSYEARRYVHLIQGDIRDPETCYRAMKGVEVVFHLAALPSVQRSILDPVTCHDVNVTGTLNVLVAARDAGVRRVVLASSSAIYGESPELPKRETMAPQPLSPYAFSKLAGEHYCKLFHQLYGLETVALRYFNVFGPRQNPKSEYAAAIPRFVTLALAGDRPTIYGDGEQTRDFIPVQNVVTANLLAAMSPFSAGKVYNIGCGQSMSLNALLGEIGWIIGRHVHAQYLPARPGDIRDSVADIEAARRDLCFEPHVSVADGLRSVIESYRLLRAA